MSGLNNKSNYNVFFLILGVFVFILGVGFIINDIDLKENGRGIASKDQISDNREIADFATKKIIKKINLSKKIRFGVDPSKLENFVYLDLNGHYKVFNSNDSTLKIQKIGEEGIKVENYQGFALKILESLMIKKDDLFIKEDSRDVASNSKGEKKTIRFSINGKSNSSLATILINVDDSSVMESVTISDLK